MQSYSKKVLSILVLAIIFTLSMSVVALADSVTSLNATVTGIELGNTPDDVKVTLDNSNVQIVGTIISYQNNVGGWDDVEPDEEFDGGINYNISIFLRPKDSNTYISSLTTKTVKLNGNNVNYYSKFNYESYTDTYRIFTFVKELKSDDFKISVKGGTAKVNGKAVTRAKVGDKVTITVDTAQIPNGKEFLIWRSNISTYERMDSTFTFTMKAESITMQAEYGYMIRSISITAEEPVAGEKPQSISDIKFNKGLYRVSQGNYWKEEYGNSYVDFNGNYKENTNYRLYLSLRADSVNDYKLYNPEGNKDAIIYNVTVNGKKVPESNITCKDNYNIDIYYDFKTGSVPSSSTTPEVSETPSTPTTPEVTETPSTSSTPDATEPVVTIPSTSELNPREEIKVIVPAEETTKVREELKEKTPAVVEETPKTETQTQTQTQTEQGGAKSNKYYEVEFETNGGTKVEYQEIDEGELVDEPKDPKKDGFIFDGWYTDKKLTKKYDFKTKVTSDFTLYAKWVESKKEETKSGDQTSKEETISTIVWLKASKWAVEELNKANEAKLIPELFNKEDLTQNITRKEFAYVAVKLYEKITGNTDRSNDVKNNPFTDVNDAEILRAYSLGITNGTTETTFSPDALITREQMATMITRALNKAGIDSTTGAIGAAAKFDDHPNISGYAIESVYFMAASDIIKGVGENKFDPKGNATREQSLLISVRSAEKFAK